MSHPSPHTTDFEMYTLANSVTDLSAKAETTRTFTYIVPTKMEATRVSSTMDKIRVKLQKQPKEVYLRYSVSVVRGRIALTHESTYAQKEKTNEFAISCVRPKDGDFAGAGVLIVAVIGAEGLSIGRRRPLFGWSSCDSSFAHCWMGISKR